jgi:hypothetical protein
MGGLSDDVRTTFKQVEGGYFFQQNPWFFGRSYGYLVDAAKRAEIIEQIRWNGNTVGRSTIRAADAGASGFFDVDERLRELSTKGDDLERLNAIVDFRDVPAPPGASGAAAGWIEGPPTLRGLRSAPSERA